MKRKKRKLRYQTGGSIITNDPNDPRLKAYQDSLSAHNDYNLYYLRGKSNMLHDFHDYNKLAEKHLTDQEKFMLKGIETTIAGKPKYNLEFKEKYIKANEGPDNKFEAGAMYPMYGKFGSDLVDMKEYAEGDPNQPIAWRLIGDPFYKSNMYFPKEYVNQILSSKGVPEDAKEYIKKHRGRSQEDRGSERTGSSRLSLRRLLQEREGKDLQLNDSGDQEIYPVYKKPVQPVVYQAKQEQDFYKKRSTPEYWDDGKGNIWQDKYTEAKDYKQRPVIKSKPKPIPQPIPKPQTREAIPVFGEEQRPYDSIMMPSGQRLTKEQFIKQYGMKTWTQKYGKMQTGGPNVPLLGLQQAIQRQNTQQSALKKYMPDDFDARQLATGQAGTMGLDDPIFNALLMGAPAAGNKIAQKLIKFTANRAAKKASPKVVQAAAPQILEGKAAQNYLNTQSTERQMKEMETWHTLQSKKKVYPWNTVQKGIFNSHPGMRMDIGKQDLRAGESLFGDQPFNFNGTVMYPKDMSQELKTKLFRDMFPNNVPKGNPTSLSWNRDVNYNQDGGPVTDPMGQLKYPGQVTRIPSNNISMAGVNYPVLGISNTGASKMMQPGASYQFPGTSVTEYPLLAGKQAVNKVEDPTYVKYGGSSDSCFPDEISFPEQRKNDFLKFLRETSFNKIKDELSNEQQQYDDYMKKGGWIQKATKGMRKDKPCTGAKFGSSSCPAGSKRYNLAKTFKKMNKQDGGTPMQQYLQKYPDRPATDTLTTGHGPYEMLDSDQFPDTTGYQRVKRTSIDQSPIYRGPEEQRRVDDLQNSFYQKYADPEWGESILDYERWTEDQRNQLPLRKTQTQHPYYPTNKPSLQGGGSFFDPYKTNVPYDVKNLKRRNNNPYNPPWDYIPNTGQKWQPHTDMSWMDTQQASDPNKLDYSPPQGFSQGQSFGLPPQPSAMDVNSDYYNMENVNQRASDESGEGITGRPNWKDRWWANPDLINAGMEGVTSIFNMFDRQKKEKELRKRTASDNLWASSAGSRGDYTTNNGYFRPDQMTPVQFPGAAGFQQYQEGGQYEADETEIQDLISQGYQISYID